VSPRKNLNGLLIRDEKLLREAVKRSCQFKAGVVMKDEREAGLRAILNYGHTFGHAIESTAGYGKLLHGEAIAYGMMAAAEMARERGMIRPSYAFQQKAMCRKLLPPAMPRMRVPVLMKAMMRDKKVLRNSLRFVLSQAEGKVAILSRIPTGQIERAWHAILSPD